MTTLINDIKFGLRLLAKQPLFTLVALLTLALGLGANLTIFSFVNAFLLRPLPYPEAERLMRFRPVNDSFGPMSIAYPNFKDWQQRNDTFESMACYRDENRILTGAGDPERLPAIRASSNLFSILGVKVQLGRLFTPEDDHGQAEPTAIISHGLWQRRFNGDPTVIGKILRLNEEAHTVVGVLPQNFQFPPMRSNQAALWLPAGLLERHDWFLNRHNHCGLSGIGKLKAGVTLSQARSDLQRVAQQMQADYPDHNNGNMIQTDPYHETLIRGIRPGIVVLMAAVGCILLIICINISGLMLVRASQRAQEFSIRTALGAERGRLLQQLLGENLVLVFLGACGGLIVAQVGIGLFVGAMGNRYGLSQSQPGLWHTNVILFFVGISLCAIIMFSILPVLQGSMGKVIAGLRSGTRTATSSRRHHQLRDTLVVTEIALALVLLSGAGLLLRSFQNYLQADPGYDPDSTLTLRLSLPEKVYDNDPKRYNVYRALIQGTKPLPGVQHVGLCSNLLGNWQSSYSVEDAPDPEPGQVFHAELNCITPGHIQAMGIRLLDGRLFTERDTEESTRVALVDERFVQRWWPQENPIGKRIRTEGNWLSVVGVVSHVKHYGIDQDSRESIYLSAFQGGFGYLTCVVRCQGDPLALVEPIRRIIRDINPDLAAFNIQSLQAIRTDQFFMRRFLTSLLTLFAGAALFLAALGLYGVTAYAVSQRTQEFGIRMALGARMSDIRQLVLGRGGKLAGIGISLGLLASLGFSYWVRGMLFGISVWDPLTFLAVTGALGVVVLAACYVPARRAAKIDPMEALRYE